MRKNIKIFRNPFLTACMNARNNAIPSPRSHCHSSTVTQALRRESSGKVFYCFYRWMTKKTRETNAIRQKRGRREKYYQKRVSRLAQKSKLRIFVTRDGCDEYGALFIAPGPDLLDGKDKRRTSARTKSPQPTFNWFIVSLLDSGTMKPSAESFILF